MIAGKINQVTTDRSSIPSPGRSDRSFVRPSFVRSFPSSFFVLRFPRAPSPNVPFGGFSHLRPFNALRSGPSRASTMPSLLRRVRQLRLLPSNVHSFPFERSLPSIDPRRVDSICSSVVASGFERSLRSFVRAIGASDQFVWERFVWMRAVRMDASGSYGSVRMGRPTAKQVALPLKLKDRFPDGCRAATDPSSPVPSAGGFPWSSGPPPASAVR